MKTTLKFNKRRTVSLVLILLFACALVFAGKKYVDFKRKVVNMQMVCWNFYTICILQEEDKRVIDNYVAYNKRDKPLGSWRMAFLYEKYQIGNRGTAWPDPAKNKWLEGGELFGKYWDPFKSWNEEPNYSYHCEYLCWNDDPRSPHYNETSVMAIVGVGTAFETLQTVKDQNDYDSKADECSSAILFVEAINSGIHWGQPGDFDIETVTKEQLFPGDTKKILIAFADRSVWYIERTVPMEILKCFMTIESSKEHDREKELAPYGRKVAFA